MVAEVAPGSALSLGKSRANSASREAGVPYVVAGRNSVITASRLASTPRSMAESCPNDRSRSRAAVATMAATAT